MKVRFIQTASSERQCFIEGREYDLPDALAADEIRAGHAVAVEQQHPAPRPQPRKPRAVKPEAETK